ncbi:MAG: GntR family transcriptional regulator [Clostridia bacterium]|nr:GntR family transcriptional regulator [Clostridia bacterium]
MDNRKVNSEPLYMKIYQSFKNQILNGILEPNEKLPSVRELAVSFMANPNTVQRALSELEREGFIYSVVGKGNYVSEKLNSAKQKEISDIYAQLKQEVKKLLSLGVDVKEIEKEITKIGGKK